MLRVRKCPPTADRPGDGDTGVDGKRQRCCPTVRFVPNPGGGHRSRSSARRLSTIVQLRLGLVWSVPLTVKSTGTRTVRGWEGVGTHIASLEARPEAPAKSG